MSTRKLIRRVPRTSTIDMGAINDPLSQTHSPASSDHYSHWFCFVKLGTDARTEEQTDGRTDTTCENSDHYRPLWWVGLVDQFSQSYVYLPDFK